MPLLIHSSKPIRLKSGTGKPDYLDAGWNCNAFSAIKKLSYLKNGKNFSKITSPETNPTVWILKIIFPAFIFHWNLNIRDVRQALKPQRWLREQSFKFLKYKKSPNIWLTGLYSTCIWISAYLMLNYSLSSRAGVVIKSKCPILMRYVIYCLISYI